MDLQIWMDRPALYGRTCQCSRLFGYGLVVTARMTYSTKTVANLFHWLNPEWIVMFVLLRHMVV